MLLTLFTLGPCNFVNIGWFLTKLVPIDRANSGLSIDNNFVKKQPMLTKLQGPKVNNVNNKVGNPQGLWSKM